MSEEEIRSIALKNGYAPQQVEERIQNTGIIADRVDFKIEMGTSLFPRYDGEEELEILYHYNIPFSENKKQKPDFFYICLVV